jgi:hypothetical protein
MNDGSLISSWYRDTVDSMSKGDDQNAMLFSDRDGCSELVRKTCCVLTARHTVLSPRYYLSFFFQQLNRQHPTLLRSSPHC